MRWTHLSKNTASCLGKKFSILVSVSLLDWRGQGLVCTQSQNGRRNSLEPQCIFHIFSTTRAPSNTNKKRGDRGCSRIKQWELEVCLSAASCSLSCQRDMTVALELKPCWQEPKGKLRFSALEERRDLSSSFPVLSDSDDSRD